ncbi:speckle targeted PIP5K1A-regulated poly(A) polymerase [Bicyclus anynana]|uniref:Speckle targeted PIP5K1A-regulated poly(A) polymerase n=1 Tax=Bicyclus anynana TaxID=110368 RepID=A0A6J1N678_BICAN|nr:speckle targeted PIP5K1A-regulated poly(A) polymerase [Bicyclus anynana]
MANAKPAKPARPAAAAAACAGKVHVAGYPEYTQPQDLARVFASYGPVTVEKLTHRFAVLRFADEDAAKDAVKDTQRINVYGEFLNVSPFTGRHPVTPRRDFVKTKHSGTIIAPEKIELKGDFHEQLDAVLDAVRLTQEEVKAIGGLYVDLEWYLQQQWPGCVALPFGSITTGLGIKSSDADCFVQVPALFRHPAANFVNKAKRLLSQYPRTFAEVLAIPRANTPIVKFLHVPTATNCDVTFKTPLGAQNSKLVAFLLHADPRLVPLAVVLKYWAKVHGLSGTGRLTNYALTMLVIFYLQQPPRPVLPPVQWLQRDRACDVIVDDWNTGFMHDHELLPKTDNTLTMSELLGGFFKFYSTFDFDKMVVCPFTGIAMKKDLFDNVKDLPPEFDRYKENVQQEFVYPLRTSTSMCVQDPIELCHNVASPVNSRLAFEIIAFCKFAADAYDNEKNNDCAEFLKIILLKKPQLPKKTYPEYRVALYPHILKCIENADWKSVVRDMVVQLFEDLCKIPLTKLERVDGVKHQKEKYMGTCVRNIWTRKRFNKAFCGCDLGCAEKQMRITEQILKVDSVELELKFRITLNINKDTKNAAVSLKMIDGDGGHYNDFGKFFISTMQGWLLALLRPHFRLKSNGSPAVGNSSGDTKQSENSDEKSVDIKADVSTPGVDTSEDNSADVSSDAHDTHDNDTSSTNDTQTNTDTLEQPKINTQEIKMPSILDQNNE